MPSPRARRLPEGVECMVVGREVFAAMRRITVRRMREINSTLLRSWLFASCVAWMSPASSANEGATRVQDADAIARSDYVTIDGVRLFMTVRGDDRRSPV